MCRNERLETNTTARISAESVFREKASAAMPEPFLVKQKSLADLIDRRRRNNEGKESMKRKKKNQSPVALIEIKIEGHGKKLFCHGANSRCGDIASGLGFHFEGEGGWVIDTKQIKEIIEASEKEQ